MWFDCPTSMNTWKSYVDFVQLDLPHFLSYIQPYFLGVYD